MGVPDIRLCRREREVIRLKNLKWEICLCGQGETLLRDSYQLKHINPWFKIFIFIFYIYLYLISNLKWLDSSKYKATQNLKIPQPSLKLSEKCKRDNRTMDNSQYLKVQQRGRLYEEHGEQSRSRNKNKKNHYTI